MESFTRLKLPPICVKSASSVLIKHCKVATTPKGMCSNLTNFPSSVTINITHGRLRTAKTVVFRTGILN